MLVSTLHRAFISPRRLELIADALVNKLPASGVILDVGSGNGALARMLMDRKPGLEIVGIDVFEWKNTFIEVQKFDGQRIPFEDLSFDAAIIVDVLHHSQDPVALLSDVKRVVRGDVVVKDHLVTGMLSRVFLAVLDYVGNGYEGVAVTRGYLDDSQWRRLLDASGYDWASRHSMKLYRLVPRAYNFAAVLRKSSK